ncbi:signal recognition particle 14kD protein-domain-containing protein [Pyronema omphalodes]|nr:signal recognition particle 14kD protein-domain-containing protein [Pyronema omphalodes]
MPQERLSNEQFFIKLTELLASATAANKHGVFLTQKAVNPVRDPGQPASSLLIRATDGQKDKSTRRKIATIVAAEDLQTFFLQYAEVAKRNMGSLKKRDKKRKSKKKKKEVVAMVPGGVGA